MCSGQAIPTYGDKRRMRIGLLGGSFNPAHRGHLALAHIALRSLALDQVWLMVSPGNPLKAGRDMAAFEQRMESVRHLVDDPRLVVTDIEPRLSTRYTVDTVRKLHRRFPLAHFVWLTGADGLVTLSRWKGWHQLVKAIPVAVMPRPGHNYAALHSAAGRYMARWRIPSRCASLLPEHKPPVWVFMSGPQDEISSTSIRQRGHFRVAQATPQPLGKLFSGERS